MQEQSAVLSRAIGSVKLKCVVVGQCRFENYVSFEQMLEGCKRVDYLAVSCLHSWQCTEVANLLRDPSNEITELNLCLYPEYLEFGQ